MEVKRKKFIYKLAAFTQDPADSSVTLETLLRKAMRKVDKAYERFQNSQGDNTEFRFLNYSGGHSPRDNNEGNGDAVFGLEFLKYEKGANQSTIQIDQNASQIDVGSLKLEDGSEFLAGSVYFCCLNNHVIINASRSLRIIDLEEYLNWFLVERAKVLTDNIRIQLNDFISETKKKKISGVKNITFTSPVKWEPAEASELDKGVKVTKEKSIPIKVVGSAWESINALFGKDSLPKTMTVESLTDTPDLEVRLLLKWKGAKDEDDGNFLDGVASNLRHVDDEVDYKIVSETGSISRKEIKIFDDKNVRWTKGRPDFNDIFPKMAEWLDFLIRAGSIEA